MNSLTIEQLPANHQIRKAFERRIENEGQPDPKIFQGLGTFKMGSPDLFTADAVTQAIENLNQAFSDTVVDVQSIHFDQNEEGGATVVADLVFKGKMEVDMSQRQIVGAAYVHSLVHRMGRDPQKCSYQINCDKWITT